MWTELAGGWWERRNGKDQRCNPVTNWKILAGLGKEAYVLMTLGLQWSWWCFQFILGRWRTFSDNRCHYIKASNTIWDQLEKGITSSEVSLSEGIASKFKHRGRKTSETQVQSPFTHIFCRWQKRWVSKMGIQGEKPELYLCHWSRSPLDWRGGRGLGPFREDNKIYWLALPRRTQRPIRECTLGKYQPLVPSRKLPQ